MSQARIVVACEQQSYRDVVMVTLAALRPYLDLIAAAPDELDRAIAVHQPHLAICSQMDEPARASLFSWVLLYPDGASYAIACIAGEQRLIPGVDLSRLLSVVDEVTNLVAPEMPS